MSVSAGPATYTTGLVSVEYNFKGESAHAAGAPWRGRSALDAVELMDVGWNFRREHLRLATRLHYVITNGGDQPNVVPPNAAVWYYFREADYDHIMNLWRIGDNMAQAATLMTDTTYSSRLLGSAWPGYFSKPIAEAMYENIKKVGLPQWSDEDQILAKAFQRELKVPVRGLATKIPELREEFRTNLRVLGNDGELNQSLEKAGRLLDFLELAELMCIDALHRTESCGGHYRLESRTPEGEARRDDEHFSYVAAWEYKGPGQPSALHKEPLTFEYVHLAQRSYK